MGVIIVGHVGVDVIIVDHGCSWWNYSRPWFVLV